MTTIRPFASTDTPALVEIYHRAVEEIGSKAYTSDQVAVWSALCPEPESFAEILGDGRHALVAVNDKDDIIAFGDVEKDGHLGFLYVHPDSAGSGVVTELYNALEAAARAQNISKLYCEASELAKSFLLKQGFSVVERRDFEVSGVPIHNYAVEKRLRAVS